MLFQTSYIKNVGTYINTIVVGYSDCYLQLFTKVKGIYTICKFYIYTTHYLTLLSITYFLFVSNSNIANNTDCNTPFLAKKLMDLLSDLEQHSGILLKSFQKKFLIVNQRNIIYYFSTDTSNALKIGKFSEANRKHEELLGIKFIILKFIIFIVI